MQVHGWFDSIPLHHTWADWRNGKRASLKRSSCPGSNPGSATKFKPRWRNGIRAGLRNRILRVRVSGGAPVKDSWQNGIAPVLKTVSPREPGGVGSIPTLSARGSLPERQWVSLLSCSRSEMVAKVRSLQLPPSIRPVRSFFVRQPGQHPPNAKANQRRADDDRGRAEHVIPAEFWRTWPWPRQSARRRP